MNPSAYNAAICAASSLTSGAVGFAASGGDEASTLIFLLTVAFGGLAALANSGRNSF